MASIAFFAVASRRLDPADYSALGVLWTAMFAVGNGLMQPLEQEVARAVSDRRAKGIGPAPVIHRAITIGAAFSLGVAVLLIATRTWLLDRWFNGDEWLVAAFIVGLIGFCAGHLTRGVLSSHHRFGRYGLFFSVDGISRVLLAGALAALGTTLVGPWGIILAIAPFLGAGAGLVGQKGLLEPGPEAPWNELTAKLGWLLIGTVCISLVVQGGTIAVQMLATPDEAAAAGVFLNGLTTARIPLFLFQAVLASLLPKLSRLASNGQYDEFVATLRRLVLLILAGGAVTTVVAAAVGPTFMARVYQSPETLSSRDIALLAGSFILIMATICLDQALVALNGHSRMAVGWLVAFAVFVGVTALGSDLFLRVELGLVAASAVAFAWMTVCLIERLRHHDRMHAVGTAEALAEIPT